MASLSTQVPRRRWIIGGLFGGDVLVDSIDRINPSVAAPQLRANFHLTATDIGLLFCDFFWSCALRAIPAGLILDWFGVTSAGRWGVLLWSIASAGVAFTSGATPEDEAASGAGSMRVYRLRLRKVCCLSIGFAAYGYTVSLFLTWLRGYVVQAIHMNTFGAAGYAAISWAWPRYRTSCSSPCWSTA